MVCWRVFWRMEEISLDRRSERPRRRRSPVEKEAIEYSTLMMLAVESSWERFSTSLGP